MLPKALVYSALIGVYEFSPKLLGNLAKFRKDLNQVSSFPEDVIVEWEQSQVDTLVEYNLETERK